MALTKTQKQLLTFNYPSIYTELFITQNQFEITNRTKDIIINSYDNDNYNKNLNFLKALKGLNYKEYDESNQALQFFIAVQKNIISIDPKLLFRGATDLKRNIQKLSLIELQFLTSQDYSEDLKTQAYSRLYDLNNKSNFNQSIILTTEQEKLLTNSGSSYNLYLNIGAFDFINENTFIRQDLKSVINRAKAIKSLPYNREDIYIKSLPFIDFIIYIANKAEDPKKIISIFESKIRIDERLQELSEKDLKIIAEQPFGIEDDITEKAKKHLKDLEDKKQNSLTNNQINILKDNIYSNVFSLYLILHKFDFITETTSIKELQEQLNQKFPCFSDSVKFTVERIKGLKKFPSEQKDLSISKCFIDFIHYLEKNTEHTKEIIELLNFANATKQQQLLLLQKLSQKEIKAIIEESSLITSCFQNFQNFQTTAKEYLEDIKNKQQLSKTDQEKIELYNYELLFKNKDEIHITEYTQLPTDKNNEDFFLCRFQFIKAIKNLPYEINSHIHPAAKQLLVESIDFFKHLEINIKDPKKLLSCSFFEWMPLFTTLSPQELQFLSSQNYKLTIRNEAQKYLQYQLSEQQITEIQNKTYSQLFIEQEDYKIHNLLTQAPKNVLANINFNFLKSIKGLSCNSKTLLLEENLAPFKELQKIIKSIQPKLLHKALQDENYKEASRLLEKLTKEELDNLAKSEIIHNIFPGYRFTINEVVGKLKNSNISNHNNILPSEQQIKLQDLTIDSVFIYDFPITQHTKIPDNANEELKENFRALRIFNGFDRLSEKDDPKIQELIGLQKNITTIKASVLHSCLLNETDIFFSKLQSLTDNELKYLSELKPYQTLSNAILQLRKLESYNIFQIIANHYSRNTSFKELLDIDYFIFDNTPTQLSKIDLLKKLSTNKTYLITDRSQINCLDFFKNTNTKHLPFSFYDDYKQNIQSLNLSQLLEVIKQPENHDTKDIIHEARKEFLHQATYSDIYLNRKLFQNFQDQDEFVDYINKNLPPLEKEQISTQESKYHHFYSLVHHNIKNPDEFIEKFYIKYDFDLSYLSDQELQIIACQDEEDIMWSGLVRDAAETLQKRQTLEEEKKIVVEEQTEEPNNNSSSVPFFLGSIAGLVLSSLIYKGHKKQPQKKQKQRVREENQEDSNSNTTIINLSSNKTEKRI